MSLARPLAAALCLGALSTLFAGAAQAVPDACPDDADIVRASIPAFRRPMRAAACMCPARTPSSWSPTWRRAILRADLQGLAGQSDLLLVAVPLMRDQSEAEAADGHEGDLDVLVLERATLAAAPAPAEGADDGRRGGPDQPDVRYRPL